MKITLPAILQPVVRRKDKSVCLKFDTRELDFKEIVTLMALEGSEGHLLYAPNEAEMALLDVPNTKAEVGIKSASERLRAVIFVHFKQAVEDGKYVGLADNFYKEQMNKVIEGYKSKNLRE